MRIFIRESGKRGLSLPLPFAALPPLVSAGLSRCSTQARRQIVAELIRARRRHPHLILVEAEDAKGSQVKIWW